MTQLNRFNQESTARDALGGNQQSGKYRAALFGGAMMLTVLLGIYGCSKESSKPAPAPPVQVAGPQPVSPDPSTPALSTPAQPTARKRRVQRRVPLATYSDPAYGVTVRYPKNYVLREGDQSRLTWPGSRPVLTDFIKPGGVTLAAIALPDGFYGKKDIAAAFVNLSVNSSLTDSECAKFASPDPSLPGIDPPLKVKVGVLHFYEMEDLSGQDTKQTDARYYHVFKNGACYEFALGVGTVSDDAAGGKTAVTSQETFRKLENVLSTARINSVVLPASQTPTNSQNNPERPAPTPMPSVKSE
jgi:hypothetical protein